MSSQTSLPAETRTEFGKGAARRLRRADKVPAVVYGHGEAPIHLSLPGHQTMLALKHRNTVLSLDVDGAEHLALAKFVQRDPIRGTIEHVDFVTVRRGEKIQVDISVLTTGDPQTGTVVTVGVQSIAVLADAMDLPESVHVDVTDAEAGFHVLVGQLELPAGVELVTDPELVAVAVAETHLAEEVEAAELEVGAGAATAAAEAEEAEQAEAEATAAEGDVVPETSDEAPSDQS
ncbi:50S ribosomal protein L25/general stress protein Ctc [Aquipuribacter hungaricus]|uniref:Large ribosomal subunit protein bL25 n=1 Tax=Aquipuribacter hungaricus TaxID=545624 RepID=A0ABV7WD20_9MICO